MHVVLLSEKACVNNFVNYKCTSVCPMATLIVVTLLISRSACIPKVHIFKIMCITLYFVLTSAKSAFEECVC